MIVVVALVIAWFTWDGVARLAASSSRPARALFLVAEGIAIAVSLVGLAGDSLPLMAVGLLIGLGGVSVTPWVARRTRRPNPFGGLAEAWTELNAFEAREHATPLSAEDQKWLDNQVSGLERWRTPDTTTVVDLWQETVRGQHSDPPMDRATFERLNAELTAEVRRLWSSARKTA
jgi:hypothetical protein